MKQRSTKPMRIILMGLPGAGKGTQGALLASSLDIPHVSIGECVRDIVAEGSSPLAEQILRQWQSGESWQPLPDEIAVQVAQTAVREKSDWVLDGFPRNLNQLRSANFLDPVDAIIFLRVSEELSAQRLLARKRKDDTRENVLQRLAVERERLQPLLDHCRKAFRFIEIDGSESASTVADLIRQHIRS